VIAIKNEEREQLVSELAVVQDAVVELKLELREERGNRLAIEEDLKASQQDYDLGHAGTRYVSPRQAGRYGDVEFATLASDAGWEISGYAVSVVPGGER
jgi:hypothetical protein